MVNDFSWYGAPPAPVTGFGTPSGGSSSGVWDTGGSSTADVDLNRVSSWQNTGQLDANGNYIEQGYNAYGYPIPGVVRSTGAGPRVSTGASTPQLSLNISTPGTTSARFTRTLRDGSVWLYDELDPTFSVQLSPPSEPRISSALRDVNGIPMAIDYTDPANARAYSISGLPSGPSGGMPDTTNINGRPYMWDASLGTLVPVPITGTPGSLNSYPGGAPAPYSAPSIQPTGYAYLPGGNGGSSARTSSLPSVADQANFDQFLTNQERLNNLNLSYQSQKAAISGNDAASQERRDQLDREFQLYMFQLQQQAQERDRQIQLTGLFQNAISSVDPGATAAFMKAYGSIGAGLRAGGTALSDAAAYPAANYLQMLQGGQSSLPIGGGGTGGTPPIGGGGTPIPGIPGSPAPTPGATPGTPPPAAPPMPEQQFGLNFSNYPEELAFVLRNYIALQGGNGLNDYLVKTMDSIVNDYYQSWDAAPTYTFSNAKNFKADQWANNLLGMMGGQGDALGDYYSRQERLSSYTRNPANQPSINLVDAMLLNYNKLRDLGANISGIPGAGQSISTTMPDYQTWAQAQLSKGMSPTTDAYLQAQQQMQSLTGEYNNYYRLTNPSTSIDPNTYGSLATQIQNAGLGLFENPTGVGTWAYQLRPTTYESTDPYTGLVTTHTKYEPMPGTGFEFQPNNPDSPFYDNSLLVPQSDPRGFTDLTDPNSGSTVPMGDSISALPQSRAMGGPVNLNEPIVVGEPVNGKPNPEIIMPLGPGRALVKPISVPEAQAMQRAGRGMADGGVLTYDQWASTYDNWRNETDSTLRKRYVSEVLGGNWRDYDLNTMTLKPVASAPAPAPIPIPAPAPTPAPAIPIPTAPTTAPEPMPVPAPAPTTAPAPTNPMAPATETVGGGTTSSAATTPPANNLPPVTQPAPTSTTSTAGLPIPPAIQPAIQEVRDLRENIPFQFISPYQQDYETAYDPASRASSEYGLQTARAIPVDVLNWERMRYRLPGTYASSMNQGL